MSTRSKENQRRLVSELNEKVKIDTKEQTIFKENCLENLEGGDIRQTSKRNMKLSSSIGFMFTDKSLDVTEVEMCRRLFCDGSKR